MERDPANTGQKHSDVFAWSITLLFLVLLMAGYAFARLSTNPMVFISIFTLLTIGQSIYVALNLRSFSRLRLRLEVGLLMLLLWGILAAYVRDLHAHPAYSALLLIYLFFLRVRGLSDRARQYD